MERLPLNGKPTKSPPSEASPAKGRQMNSSDQGRSGASSRSRPSNNSDATEKEPLNGRHSGRATFPLPESSGASGAVSGGIWGALTEMVMCAWAVIRSRGISGLYLGFYLQVISQFLNLFSPPFTDLSSPQALKEMVGNIALFGTYDTLTLLVKEMQSSGQFWIAIWPAGSLAGIAYYLVCCFLLVKE